MTSRCINVPCLYFSLPQFSTDITAPENVLFVCKLNPVTDSEDLTLIFSRFDPNVKAEVIRDTVCLCGIFDATTVQ